MYFLKLMVAVLLGVSTSAWAKIELELSGGLASQSIKSDDETFSTASPDLNLMVGYQLKKFPLSIGLLVSQKNYDTGAYSRQYASRAQDFYEDPSLFSSPADVTSAESSGSWQGLVYGPQILLSVGWKRFDPYLRASYQMGTLKSMIDFTSSGTYLGVPLTYDFKIEDEMKTSVIQYGLGFRTHIGVSYLFLDYGIEKMNAQGSKEVTSYRSIQGDVETIGEGSSTSQASHQLEGQVIRGGLGLSF